MSCFRKIDILMSAADANVKYDRQIRLWGVDGQKLINAAKVVCFGSDILTTEFLKSMSLHAVGHIVIIDDAVVTEADLMQNFFVANEDLNKKRAEVTSERIHELNPDYTVEYIIKPRDDYKILEDSSYDSNTLVFTSGMISSSKMEELSNIIRKKGMRQIHVTCSGFYGGIYLDANDHYALPGGTMTTESMDYRISQPWKELAEYMENANFDNLDVIGKNHYPWIVLSYYILKHLKDQDKDYDPIKNGKSKEYKDKFVTQLTEDKKADLAKKGYSKDYDIKYDKVKTNYEKLCQQPVWPNYATNLKSLDSKPKTKFWECVRATEEFKKLHGVYPLVGDIPDMESKNTIFREIKAIYKDKHEKDTEEMIKMLPDVDPEFVRQYCNNYWKSRGCVYDTLPVTMARRNRNAFIETVFIAEREFFSKNNRLPDVNNEEDFKYIFENSKKLITNFNEQNDSEKLEKIIKCYLRFGGKILAGVASTVCSLAAQEATKVIIHQQTPIENAAVFDFVENQFN